MAYDFLSPDVLQQAMRSWPIRRLGRLEDIADSTLFPASDRAGVLTGQKIGARGVLPCGEPGQMPTDQPEKALAGVEKLLSSHY